MVDNNKNNNTTQSPQNNTNSNANDIPLSEDVLYNYVNAATGKKQPSITASPNSNQNPQTNNAKQVKSQSNTHTHQTSTSSANTKTDHKNQSNVTKQASNTNVSKDPRGSNSTKNIQSTQDTAPVSTNNISPKTKNNTSQFQDNNTNTSAATTQNPPTPPSQTTTPSQTGTGAQTTNAPTTEPQTTAGVQTTTTTKSATESSTTQTAVNNNTNAPNTTTQNAPTKPQTSPDIPIPTVQAQPQQTPYGQVQATIPASNFEIAILLEEVIKRNASDLHIAVGYPPLIRVDGKLYAYGSKPLGPNETQRLVYSILSAEKRDILEVNKEVDFAYSYKNIGRFRVNAYHSKGFLTAALRLIPTRIRSIDELHLPKMYHQLADLEQGFVLVTGPTGHGKSTTLAAIIQEINIKYPKHILTIEDPIEYVFPPAKSLVTQRELGQDTNSWKIALRSALREDPDVVLIGEMRDYETIDAAINIAETGHLVFSTLHTNSASQTIDRIISVFPAEQQNKVRAQLAEVIKVIISQRLIPLKQGGRMAVSEIMIMNNAIKNLIREGKIYQIDNVIRTGSEEGMLSLERSLVNLVRQGLITPEEAQKYAWDPEEITRLLSVGI